MQKMSEKKSFQKAIISNIQTMRILVRKEGLALTFRWSNEAC